MGPSYFLKSSTFANVHLFTCNELHNVLLHDKHFSLLLGKRSIGMVSCVCFAHNQNTGYFMETFIMLNDLCVMLFVLFISYLWCSFVVAELRICKIEIVVQILGS